MDNKRVLVGLSGGVDSSVCALLLQRMDYAVLGATLDLCDGAASDSIEDAAAVADKLGIPFSAFDFRADFERCVMERFAADYRAGRTPNPCIVCNPNVKFAKMLECADALGCTHIATGHYARVEYDEKRGRWLLKKGRNLSKDQSYVLYRLDQRQLSRTLMPLGDMESKDAIRAIAEDAGLVTARKKDSQDICFIPDGDYTAFLQRRGVELTPGSFVDEAGRVLGQHRGLPCYTTGQRKGLGVDGIMLSCTIFSPYIDLLRSFTDLPILAADVGVFEKAATDYRKIGAVVSFEPTLKSVSAVVDACREKINPDFDVEIKLAEGAFAAMQRGDAQTHNRILYETACSMAEGKDAIVLSQMSHMRAMPLFENFPIPVLTSPPVSLQLLCDRIDEKKKEA